MWIVQNIYREAFHVFLFASVRVEVEGGLDDLRKSVTIDSDLRVLKMSPRCACGGEGGYPTNFKCCDLKMAPPQIIPPQNVVNWPPQNVRADQNVASISLLQISPPQSIAT